MSEVILEIADTQQIGRLSSLLFYPDLLNVYVTLCRQSLRLRFADATHNARRRH